MDDDSGPDADSGADRDADSGADRDADRDRVDAVGGAHHQTTLGGDRLARPAGTPVLSATVGTNAEVFRDVLALHVPAGAAVADVTHGRGAFWEAVPPGRYDVTATDLDPSRSPDAPEGADARDLPFAADSFDAVVFDPPYAAGLHRPDDTAAGRGSHESFRRAYRGGETAPADAAAAPDQPAGRAERGASTGRAPDGSDGGGGRADAGGGAGADPSGDPSGSPGGGPVAGVPTGYGRVLALYYDAGREARRVLRPDGAYIVKVQDQVTANTQHLTHVQVVAHHEAHLGLHTADLFVVVRPNDPRQTGVDEQVHARKNHSYFLVFRPEGDPANVPPPTDRA